MTEPHPWDEAPERPDPYILDLSRFDPTSEAGKKAVNAQRKGKKRGKKKDPEPKKPEIPKLPTKEVALTGDEVRRGVSERSRSAANLKVEGYTYDEIADLLEFESPRDAKRAVEGVLAAIHGPGDYETLRTVAAARAERLFQRSAAMAGATFLETEDGERIVNADRLRWHGQAAIDLANWAKITGAVAPTKVEVTPGDEQMERLLGMVLEKAGHEEILDAEVIELEYLPPPPVDEIDEEDEDADQ